MKFLERRKILRSTSAPDLIPVQIRGFDIEEEKVVVLVPKFESKIYHLFSPRLEKLFFRIKLDDLGSATWEAIDGKRNVREIGEFIKKQKADVKIETIDLDDRLSKYMTLLYEKRFISFRQIMWEGRR
ncbi:MAG: PqqD family peptide modification chaperone [Bacteroidales bacterium]|nr:PqqD family peptide modification chaperone [Bacteroidales bacterium]